MPSLPHHGRYVRLDTVSSANLPFVEWLVNHPSVHVAWRTRGQYLSPGRLLEVLDQAVLSQYVIVAKRNEAQIGLATAYDADFRNGIVWLALAVHPEHRRSFAVWEGVALFLDYVFRAFPMRKVMVQSPEFAWRELAGKDTSRLIRIEGRLADMEYHDGRYHDVIFASITRAEFEVLASVLLNDVST